MPRCRNRIREFYPHQKTGLQKTLNAAEVYRNILLAMCVSSGKTLVSLVSAYLLMRLRRISHSIVLVPTVDLRHQYYLESLNRVDWGEGLKRLKVREVLNSNSLILYLIDPNRYRETVVCTYHIFRSRGRWEDLRRHIERLGTQLQIISDEGHHIHLEGEDSNWISECMAQTEAAGVFSTKLSATPSRADMRPVYDERYEFYEWSLLDNMLHNRTPDPLLSRLIVVEGGGHSSGQGEEATIAIPDDNVRMIDAIMEDMERDGWPKSIVRFKFGKDVNDTRAAMEDLRSRIEASGRTCVMGYWEGLDDTQEQIRRETAWKALIEQENSDGSSDPEGRPRRGRRPRGPVYSESPDVVIVVRRGDEGLNFPSRSHYYFVGIPSFLPIVIQCLGRILRLRTHWIGYPEPWVNQAKVVFCTANLEGIVPAHHRFLVSLCSCMDSFRSVHLLKLMFHAQGRTPITSSGERPEGVSGGEEEEPLRVAQEVQLRVHELWVQVENLYEMFRTPYTRHLSPPDIEKAILALDAAQREANPEDSYPPLEPFHIHLAMLPALQNRGCDPMPTIIQMIQADPEDQDIIRTAMARALQELDQAVSVNDSLLHILPANVQERISERIQEFLQRAINPRPNAEILCDVEEFRGNNGGNFPTVRDVGARNGFSDFRPDDRNLRMGRGEEHLPGGYPALIMRQYSDGNWFDNIRGVLELSKRDSYLGSHISYEGPYRSLVENRIRQIPEGVYLKAWKTVDRYLYDEGRLDIRGKVTIEEAEMLGQYSLRVLRAWLDLPGGVDGLIEAMRQGTNLASILEGP